MLTFCYIEIWKKGSRYFCVAFFTDETEHIQKRATKIILLGLSWEKMVDQNSNEPRFAMISEDFIDILICTSFLTD